MIVQTRTIDGGAARDDIRSLPALFGGCQTARAYRPDKARS